MSVPAAIRQARGLLFFPGVHHPHNAAKVRRAFISDNALRRRKGPFPVNQWIKDSGAFSIIDQHGGYPEPPEAYAARIKRWSTNGELLAAVSQDYMCERHMLKRTRALPVALRMFRRGYIDRVDWREIVRIHQRWTIKRYDRLIRCDLGGVYLMPVLQGYDPQDYVDHLRMYGDRLAHGAWVGVGSVCKRNANPGAVAAVLFAIKQERPDLLLHGFGVKTTALGDGLVRELLTTADSMAWSFAARYEGRDGNDIGEAIRFAERIDTMRPQPSLLVSAIPRHTPASFAARCREIVSTMRGHDAHRALDLLSNDVLTDLGFGDGVAIFEAAVRDWHLPDLPYPTPQEAA